MKKAQVDWGILVAIVLIAIVILVTGAFIINNYVSFTDTVPDSIVTQNKQCKTYTQQFLGKQNQLIDTDLDGLADVCDPCPNNYLSDEDDNFNTDLDGDGLSEEKLKRNNVPILSKYNPGQRKYVTNYCDNKIAVGEKAQCYNNWDGVRKKCFCDPDLGYYKDRCGTTAEWNDEQHDYYDDVLANALLLIYDGKNKEGLRYLKGAKDKFSDTGIFTDGVVLGQMIDTLELLDKDELSQEEFDELQTLAESAASAKNAKYDQAHKLIKGLAFLRLSKEVDGRYFLENREYLQKAYALVKPIRTDRYPKNYENLRKITDEIIDEAGKLIIKDRQIARFEPIGAKTKDAQGNDRVQNPLGAKVHLTDRSFFRINYRSEDDGDEEEIYLVVEWNAAGGTASATMDSRDEIDQVIFRRWIEYLNTECQWNANECLKLDVKFPDYMGIDQSRDLYFPRRFWQFDNKPNPLS